MKIQNTSVMIMRGKADCLEEPLAKLRDPSRGGICTLTKYLPDVTVRNTSRCSSAYNSALYELKATTGRAGASQGWER